MKSKVKLLPDQTENLSNLPEKGMGYQIVDIELISGKKLRNLIVLNATFLEIPEGEKIDPREIKAICLHD